MRYPSPTQREILPNEEEKLVKFWDPQIKTGVNMTLDKRTDLNENVNQTIDC